MSSVIELKPRIEVEGVGAYTNIEAYRINGDYLTPTDEWEVTLYNHKDPAQLRRIFRPKRPIKLYLGDTLQMVGRIDGHEGTGNGQRSLRVYGRDYLADLVDAGIDPAVRIKKGESLWALLLTAFEPWGIDTSIGNFDAMRNATTGKNPFTGQPARDFKALTVEESKPTAGQGAFEWGSGIAARHGATIQPSTKRNEICICEPEYNQGALYQFTRKKSGECNIESGTARVDWSDVPTVTVATGRGAASGTKATGLALTVPSFSEGSPSELYKNREIQYTITGPNSGVAAVESVFNPKQKVTVLYDSPAPWYCPMYYQDKESKNREQLERGVRRMLSERLRKTLMYEVEVQGLCDRASGAVYGLDTIAHVTDEIEDVDEDLWIFGRTLTQDPGRGPTTRLQLIRPKSLML
jgi:prophage tail gpP-like protein